MIFKLKHNCLAMQAKLTQGVDTPLLLKHCIVGIYYKPFNFEKFCDFKYL